MWTLKNIENIRNILYFLKIKNGLPKQDIKLQNSENLYA